ncbi:endothelin-converting enzyme homolog [Trichonephila clavata]|uniref:Endothelin-converting enzyme homolog n=2 Tax=Trichonephila clavata TaxID=2740835 RepID=A0A8X6L0D8_TRICU|nr:endothelin-converting enzyme homolog [Trichonephila clavata]
MSEIEPKLSTKSLQTSPKEIPLLFSPRELYCPSREVWESQAVKRISFLPPPWKSSYFLLLSGINHACETLYKTPECNHEVKKARSTIAFRDEIRNEEKLNDYYSQVEIGEVHFSNVKSAFAFKMKERMKGLETIRTEAKWSNMNNVLIANAFYMPNRNTIVLPIGLLQEIFFSSGRPNYINYGSLGSILGHEFTHAFDNAGSLYDEDGNYRMWWTEQSWKSYKEKTQCFVDQYNEFYEPKVDSLLNGSITLGENIADNGGLLAAFSAYQKLLKRIRNEPKLPGLPYSERQMFWISFASVWCRKQTDHHLELTMENSAHAPAKFRVNGALSNIKEFSEDFNCELGSKMNPTSKCLLWK